MFAALKNPLCRLRVCEVHKAGCRQIRQSRQSCAGKNRNFGGMCCRKIRSETAAFVVEWLSGELGLKRKRATSRCSDSFCQRLTERIAVVGEPHPRRKLRGVLSAVRKDDQFTVRVLRRRGYLPQQSVGKNLGNLLKTGAHDANRGVKPAASPILIAAWTNCRIRLTRSVIGWRIWPMHRRHVIQVAIASAERDRAIGGRQICRTPMPPCRNLIPLRCHRRAIVRRPEHGVVPILAVKECHLWRRLKVRMICAEKIRPRILRVIAPITAKENLSASFTRKQFKHARAATTTQRWLIVKRANRTGFGSASDPTAL